MENLKAFGAICVAILIAGVANLFLFGGLKAVWDYLNHF